MSTEMIVQMVSGNRIMVQGILFRRDDRAYKVADSFGMELLELNENDLPLFRQTRLERLADDTHIIDLLKGEGSEGDSDGSGDVVEKEVGGKVITTKPTVGRTASDIRKELELVEEQEALVDRDNSNENEMKSLMDEDDLDPKPAKKSGLKLKSKKLKAKFKSTEVAEI